MHRSPAGRSKAAGGLYFWTSMAERENSREKLRKVVVVWWWGVGVGRTSLGIVILNSREICILECSLLILPLDTGLRNDWKWKMLSFGKFNVLGFMGIFDYMNYEPISQPRRALVVMVPNLPRGSLGVWEVPNKETTWHPHGIYKGSHLSTSAMKHRTVSLSFPLSWRALIFLTQKVRGPKRRTVGGACGWGLVSWVWAAFLGTTSFGNDDISLQRPRRVVSRQGGSFLVLLYLFLNRWNLA